MFNNRSNEKGDLIMDKKQLVDLVITPFLKLMHNGISGELAITMIIAHESRRGQYLKQVGGPALGLIGMEPATHNSCWRHGDSIWQNSLKLGIIDKFTYDNKHMPSAQRLIYDLQYNVFMARQRLFMKPEALPTNIDELSRYLKKHWNSIQGAADNMSYRDDYLKWK